jgi:hypothetical protein
MRVPQTKPVQLVGALIGAARSCPDFVLTRCKVTKMELMKQLEAAVDEAIRTEMWGTLGVSFSGGVPVILRKEVTTKIDSYKEGKDRNHANRNYR